MPHFEFEVANFLRLLIMTIFEFDDIFVTFEGGCCNEVRVSSNDFAQVSFSLHYGFCPLEKLTFHF